VLQCVAVCGRVLQCVAVYCSGVQCVAVRCSASHLTNIQHVSSGALQPLAVQAPFPSHFSGSQTHARTHTHIQAYTHAHSHAHTHSYTHTYTHTSTHTHTTHGQQLVAVPSSRGTIRLGPLSTTATHCNIHARQHTATHHNIQWLVVAPSSRGTIPLRPLTTTATHCNIHALQRTATHHNVHRLVAAPSSRGTVPLGPLTTTATHCNNTLQHTTTYSGLLQPLVVEALFPSDLSQPERLVEHNQFVPLLPVVPPSPLAATVTPQILSSGSRTTVSVTLRLSGRLPRDGVVQLELPAAFRINDGDTTAVIASSIAGAAGQMSIVSADVHSGVVNVRLDPAAQVSLALSITYFTHSHTHSHTHTHT